QRSSQFGQAVCRLHDHQRSSRRAAKIRIAEFALGRGNDHAEIPEGQQNRRAGAQAIDQLLSQKRRRRRTPIQRGTGEDSQGFVKGCSAKNRPSDFDDFKRFERIPRRSRCYLEKKTTCSPALGPEHPAEKCFDATGGPSVSASWSKRSRVQPKCDCWAKTSSSFVMGLGDSALSNCIARIAALRWNLAG